MNEKGLGVVMTILSIYIDISDTIHLSLNLILGVMLQLMV